jgi:hypothetical protein
MKDPGFLKSTWLGAVALLTAAGMVFAQPPEGTPNKRVVARARPQVIYHLPPSSNSAATLHSQAKTPNNDLPIEGDMPTSLQMSRENANAAAARAREEHANTRAQGVQPPRRVKQPKAQSARVVRPQPVKASRPAHGGPKKSHKK